MCRMHALQVPVWCVYVCMCPSTAEAHRLHGAVCCRGLSAFPSLNKHTKCVTYLSSTFMWLAALNAPCPCTTGP